MHLDHLKNEYEKMQQIYGDESLKSINFGGCDKNPDICFLLRPQPTTPLPLQAQTEICGGSFER